MLGLVVYFLVIIRLEQGWTSPSKVQDSLAPRQKPKGLFPFQGAKGLIVGCHWKSVKLPSSKAVSCSYLRHSPILSTGITRRRSVLFLYLRLQHTLVMVTGFRIKQLKPSKQWGLERHCLVTKPSSLLSHKNIFENSFNEFTNCLHASPLFCCCCYPRHSLLKHLCACSGLACSHARLCQHSWESLRFILSHPPFHRVL